MKIIALAGLSVVTALGLPPLAGADPIPGYENTIVATQSPSMLCQIFLDEPESGPNVDCQSDNFPQAPKLHQASVNASGQFHYFDGNIGTGGDDFNPQTLGRGQIYHVQGWTIVPTDDGITFTNDATSHGMVIAADKNVKPF
jgi:hypothetical protein